MSEKFDCSVINHLINQLSPATIKILPLHREVVPVIWTPEWVS